MPLNTNQPPIDYTITKFHLKFSGLGICAKFYLKGNGEGSTKVYV